MWLSGTTVVGVVRAGEPNAVAHAQSSTLMSQFTGLVVVVDVDVLVLLVVVVDDVEVVGIRYAPYNARSKLW